ncbi:unnamed protein product [Cuscuta campestris]|uniref:Uncharacterized protein n=1 Tax=Cuscuta campestris TaxID=132261 RepID=A0A484LHG4_9ASTE|nr:unnamed protein product [Cuscuta campestris]
MMGFSTLQMRESRVVLGRADRAVRGVTAVNRTQCQYSICESLRDELQSLHPHDLQIVVLKHQGWRVEGLIQPADWDDREYIDSLDD